MLFPLEVQFMVFPRLGKAAWLDDAAPVREAPVNLREENRHFFRLNK